MLHNHNITPLCHELTITKTISRRARGKRGDSALAFCWVCTAGVQHRLQSITIAFHDYFDCTYRRNQFSLHPNSMRLPVRWATAPSVMFNLSQGYSLYWSAVSLLIGSKIAAEKKRQWRQFYAVLRSPRRVMSSSRGCRKPAD